MRNNLPDLNNKRLHFETETSPQLAFKLIHYTAKLKILLDSQPLLKSSAELNSHTESCEHICADSIEAEILDHYLCVVGDLIYGIYQLSGNLKHHKGEVSANTTGSQL